MASPLCIGVAVIVMVNAARCSPAQIAPGDTVKYLQTGGLISYDLDIDECDHDLPAAIRAYSFGGRPHNVMFLTGHSSTFEFSLPRAVNGTKYGLKENPIRFTQVSFEPTTMFVELTDVDPEGPKFVATGSVTCDYSKQGIQVYTRNIPGKELSALADIKRHLKMGYDLTYVLQWGMCTPSSNTTDTVGWAGSIYGYRFDQSGDATFTQLIDSAQTEFYIEAKVMTSGTVKVEMFSDDRLQHLRSAVQSRMCKLGNGYRMFVRQDV